MARREIFLGVGRYPMMEVGLQAAEPLPHAPDPCFLTRTSELPNGSLWIRPQLLTSPMHSLVGSVVMGRHCHARADLQRPPATSTERPGGHVTPPNPLRSTSTSDYIQGSVSLSLPDRASESRYLYPFQDRTAQPVTSPFCSHLLSRFYYSPSGLRPVLSSHDWTDSHPITTSAPFPFLVVVPFVYLPSLDSLPPSAPCTSGIQLLVVAFLTLYPLPSLSFDLRFRTVPPILISTYTSDVQ